jgi:glutamate racemase
VIATEATVSSHAYRDALRHHGLEAYEKACPLLVPLVEEGWVEHPVTEQVARIYLGDAMAESSEKADVLVLACTHYPLLTPLLRRITPEHVKIVDSAESTARVVMNRLPDGNGNVAAHDHRTFRFCVTDSTDKFKRLATRFLGRQVDRVDHVDLGG